MSARTRPLYDWEADPGTIRVRDRHEARVVRLVVGDGADLVDLPSGSAVGRIRPTSATVEFRAGDLYEIQLTGRGIRKDGRPAERIGQQSWYWRRWTHDAVSWPPADVPPLALQVVDLARSDWDGVPAAADGALPGWEQR